MSVNEGKEVLYVVEIFDQLQICMCLALGCQFFKNHTYFDPTWCREFQEEC
jgi:hypothetical protein